MPKVAILGGGVGGLSAAHELVERGFEVTVYEAKNIWGGKARSMGKPKSGKDGRLDLPGEHGFRFFPGFYKHLPDTMKRIPFSGNTHGVFDNLTHTTQTGILQEGADPIVMPANFPTTLHEWMETFHTIFHSHFGIPAHEACVFANKLLVILSSCKQRRLAEYEKTPWWDFIRATKMSVEYRKLLGIGLTRSLVAMKAEVASTRTVGDILLQLLLNSLTPGVMVDRVLNGPTNQVWIDPWIEHLKKHRAQMHLNAKTVRLNFDGRQITSATVSIDGKEENVQADYYICAFPVEVLNRLVTDDIKKAAPSLARTAKLGTQWMNGIQFYLRRDVPVINGHGLYLDSAWALTSISQHQFWPKVDLSKYGDGRVQGIISVDISDWFNAGDKLVKLPAHECTPEQIKNEVWAQLKAHLRENKRAEISDDDLLDWHLDPDIQFPRCQQGNEGNEEPLLVNTIGSWEDRPEAHVEIPNLFLASDYVRTNTDLATMEGANEAGRRAVNAILKAARSRAKRCKIWPLHEPVVFAPLRGYDYIRFRLGLKHGGWILGSILCALIALGIAGGFVGAIMALTESDFLAAVAYFIIGAIAFILAWPIFRTVFGLIKGRHLLTPVPHPQAGK
jgi:uncharacterized protein with NAD-binding domain and iron-sulfur cluster